MPASSRRRPLRRIVLMAFVAIFVAIAYGLFISRVDRRPIPTVPAVIVGHVLDSGGLGAYDCRQAAVERLREPSNVDWLLGYSPSHTTWASVREGDLLSPDYKLLLTKPKRSIVVCSGDVSLYSSAICDDILYVPVHEQGRVALKCYSLDGKPVGQIRLRMDNVSAGFWIAVAPGGLIAASLVRRGTGGEPYIYLFGDDGKLKRCLGSGSDPRFSANGRYLAYREITTAKDLSVRDTGSIMILDLKTKEEKSAPPPKPERSCRKVRVGFPAGYQLSPDGQALICTYIQYWPIRTATQSVCVVDLSGRRPRRHKLPIRTLYGWVVLDKAPARLVYDLDKKQGTLLPRKEQGL